MSLWTLIATEMRKTQVEMNKVAHLGVSVLRLHNI